MIKQYMYKVEYNTRWFLLTRKLGGGAGGGSPYNAMRLLKPFLKLKKFFMIISLVGRGWRLYPCLRCPILTLMSSSNLY